MAVAQLKSMSVKTWLVLAKQREAERTDGRGAAKVDEGPGVGERPPEDVGRLDISVTHASRVQVRQPLCNVHEHKQRGGKVWGDAGRPLVQALPFLHLQAVG